jgi:mitochondrial import inner membrane translocase subunit TIM22
MSSPEERDANAELGIRASDLDAEKPPNLFMYPRSFLNLHRDGSFYPFLPVYPPQFLQFVQPNPLLESCAGKFFLSATMGAFSQTDTYEGTMPEATHPALRVS